MMYFCNFYAKISDISFIYCNFAADLEIINLIRREKLWKKDSRSSLFVS